MKLEYISDIKQTIGRLNINGGKYNVNLAVDKGSTVEVDDFIGFKLLETNLFKKIEKKEKQIKNIRKEEGI